MQAELKGSVALDKMIEAAMEVENDPELRETAALLPPIHQPGGVAGGGGGGGVNGTAAPTAAGARSTGSPRRTASPGPVARVKGTLAKRVSPNGHVLNASVDTSLASTIRPKVGRGRGGGAGSAGPGTAGRPWGRG
jgi:hypothetical protein